ncbi:MAG: hypothetical protein K0S61_2538 [Anaerocolumna sp.]|jgi:hypothetical protein|nr:hypothetical protein [Anaerocolumna sp.]
MEYSLEELLPIVEKLTSKYTSNESTSITYETANMLMEAVMYCIDELEKEDNALLSIEKLDAKLAYKQGYDRVIAKVFKTKQIYEELLLDFYDYRCRNLKDTIIKGMPEFFLRYDPHFNPGDHLLTLDYPTIGAVHTLKGIDAIYQYLINIKIENDFLSVFPHYSIENMLEQQVVDYAEYYYDNICYDVLLSCIGCIIAERPVKLLVLLPEDMKTVEDFFAGDNVKEAEMKIRMLINSLVEKGINGDITMKEYFYKVAGEFGVRILNGIKNHSLLEVFGLRDFRTIY